MRLAGLALLLVGITFAQGQLVIPQTNNLNAVLSLIPQLQVNRTPNEDLQSLAFLGPRRSTGRDPPPTCWSFILERITIVER
jgi:hypothetical protein